MSPYVLTGRKVGETELVGILESRYINIINYLIKRDNNCGGKKDNNWVIIFTQKKRENNCGHLVRENRFNYFPK